MARRMTPVPIRLMIDIACIARPPTETTPMLDPASLPPLATRPARLDWYEQARFGLSAHWGLYSIPGEGEWIRAVKRLTVEQYQPYFDAFNPQPGCCRAWAKLAKQSGARYMVLTAKHHDGFCLWDSELTNYTSMHTPARRDLVREFVGALRDEGIRVGLYYSLVDWHHPDYGPVFGDRQHPLRHDPAQKSLDARRDWSRYVRYLHGQVEELLTHYGHIDLLYFDFSYWQFTGEHWGATELMKLVRRLQPDIVTNDRLGFEPLKQPTPPSFAGDFDHAEQNIPRSFVLNAHGERIPFEAWFTVTNSWCHNPTDHDHKTSATIVRALVNAVSKGGNLCLNIGPDAAGRVSATSATILGEIGAWLAVNGESIHSCGPAPLAKPEWGRYTLSSDLRRLYAHILDPVVGHLCLPDLRGVVSNPRVLATGAPAILGDYWNPGVQTFDGPTDIFLNTAAPLQCTFPLPDPIDTVVGLDVLQSPADRASFLKLLDAARDNSLERKPFE